MWAMGILCANFVALARPQESRESIHLIKDGGSIVFLESQNHVMVSSLLNFATKIYSQSEFSLIYRDSSLEPRATMFDRAKLSSPLKEKH